MTTELHPRDCLIRLCRFCKRPMIQETYEWDTEFRWYNFVCDFCEHTCLIGEPLSLWARESNVGELETEPLTDEENAVVEHD